MLWTRCRRCRLMGRWCISLPVRPPLPLARLLRGAPVAAAHRRTPRRASSRRPLAAVADAGRGGRGRGGLGARPGAAGHRLPRGRRLLRHFVCVGGWAGGGPGSTAGLSVDVRVASRTVKALIPRTVVPATAVMAGIARLNSSAFPLSIRVLFIKWVIVVYDLIDSKKELWNLYGVLFLYLDFEILVRTYQLFILLPAPGLCCR
jgi:hypothetical protein